MEIYLEEVMTQTTQPTFEGKPCRNCKATLRFVFGSKQCVACKERAAKRWRDSHPKRDRGKHWGYLYGLKSGEADLLFQQQNSKCAICQSDKASSWHIDHCHTTNIVRGILCHHCNVMLGMAKDNPQTLLNAIKYLDK